MVWQYPRRPGMGCGEVLIEEVQSDVLTFAFHMSRFFWRRHYTLHYIFHYSSVYHDEEQLVTNGKAAFSQCQQIERTAMSSLRRKMELH